MRCLKITMKAIYLNENCRNSQTNCKHAAVDAKRQYFSSQEISPPFTLPSESTLRCQCAVFTGRKITIIRELHQG